MEAMTIMVYDDSRMGMGSLSTVSVVASDRDAELTALHRRAMERVAELELENERLIRALIQVRHDARISVDDPKPEPATDVDRVIDQLDRRLVPERDRFRLRRHLDRADAPQRGRPGADEGLGRAIGRPAQSIGTKLP